MFLSIGIYSDNLLFFDYVPDSSSYGLSAHMSMNEILRELVKVFYFLGGLTIGRSNMVFEKSFCGCRRALCIRVFNN